MYLIFVLKHEFWFETDSFNRTEIWILSFSLLTLEVPYFLTRIHYLVFCIFNSKTISF